LIYNKTGKAFERRVLLTTYIKNWWSGVRLSTKSNEIIIDLRTGAF
jgi:hypothetical protein